MSSISMHSSEQNDEKYGNHAQVWAVLPWYINGSLSASERQFVAEHTAVCLVCRKELVLQRALRDSIQASALDDVMLTASFDRLTAQLASPDGASAPVVAGRFVSGLRGQLRQWAMPAYAAAAALVVAVGLVALNDSRVPVNNTFRTLSNVTADATTSANLRIIFEESLSTSERAAILRQAGLTAVTGPDTRGLYYVKSANPSPEAIEADLRKLQGNPSIVFAEAVVATASEGGQ